MAGRERRRGVSAGLLLFRRHPDLEVFLAHPGGPFWVNRNRGAWTIPKGSWETGEELLETAIREFREETGMSPYPPYIPLGCVRQRAGKEVHAWAWEGDADPSVLRSNVTKSEWPRGSGRWISYPEIDRADWFTLDRAQIVLNPAQLDFVYRLMDQLRTR